MNTPEEKAKELFSTFRYAMSCAGLKGDEKDSPAKQCALICIQQLQEYNAKCPFPYEIDSVYWCSVESHIEKL